MQLKLLGRIIRLPAKNDAESVSNLIQTELQRANLYLSAMVIDGTEIYDDYNEYLSEHWENVHEIEVKTRTLKELVQEILISAVQYLERIEPEIQLLADDFYREDIAAWEKLSQLIEGIQWLLDTFMMIDKIHNLNDLLPDYSAWNDYAQNVGELQTKVAAIAEAVKDRDSILLADLLQYELLTLFQSMRENLSGII